MIQLNELTVREKPVGGTVLHTVRWRGKISPFRCDKLIILIHGFNVSPEEATEKYAAFLGQLQIQLGPGPSAELPSIWAFQWPGDHVNPILAKATYPARVSDARLAGELLGELLTRLGSKQKVILIGHSLGCRVLLEALRVFNTRVRDHDVGADVSFACLLAAAVPIRRCEADQALYGSDIIPDNIHVLYSGNDRVLRWVFPRGQSVFEKDEGEAVGLHGGPGHRWFKVHDTGLFHKSYWEKSKSAALVARMIEPTLPRIQFARPLPVEESAAARMLDSRQPPKRAVGDNLATEWNDCWPPAVSSRKA
jgi:pimeloyl-ACP methyl ester carboxylesterase